MEYPPLPADLARSLDRMEFASWASGLRSALAELAAVLAPSDCVFCQVPDAVMCPACRSAFRAATVRPFEAQAGAEGLPLMAGGEPLRVVAAGVYSREVSAAVLSFKNRQRVSLARVLGPAMAGAIRAAAMGMPGPVALVPVPSSRMARARRGYAPVDVLVDWVARRGLLPAGAVVFPALRVLPRPPWAVSEQKTKGRRARSAGAAALAMRHGLMVSEWPVLLVDDVLTTGSTLAHAYRTLLQAGARVEGAAVLAATAPPRQDDHVPAVSPGGAAPGDTPVPETSGGLAPGVRGLAA